MKVTKKINIRMTMRESEAIAMAARQYEKSINRFLVDAALEKIEKGAQQVDVKQHILDALSEQTEALVGVLAGVSEQHAEQDAALRSDIKTALNKVLVEVRSKRQGGRA